jgi:flagellar M-ring protein FliF
MVNNNTRIKRIVLLFALRVGERMQGFISVWNGLTTGKRLLLLIVVPATIFAFSMLARTASTPSMTLLYSGLDSSSAGEVVAALERLDVRTDVRGDSIYVPADKRDSVRMSLAREGLPQQGQAGYELLESLNGFSTTSDLFDVTYWRAVEGELARTIVATPGIKSARVHIAQGRGGAFSRNAPESKAVVTVTMGRGNLSVGQAQAIRFLVSSSVPALSAERVAVLDSDRGVVLSPGNLEQVAGGQSGGADRERKLEAGVLNLLEARVGAGNVRVQIAVEIDREREAITERVIDPAGRVMSGKETTEVTETTSGANSSAVTVASNLPEGDASGGGSQSSSERTQTDESVTYDLSEIRREREKLPGSIKRLSVAVLVNEIAAEGQDGVAAPTPRTEEELTALKDLVAMAVGIDESRGDTLTIHSMPFKQITNDGVIVEQDAVADFIDRNLMTVIQIGILSVVTLILGLFVVKPLLTANAAAAAAAPALPAAPAQMDALAAAPAPMATAAPGSDAIEALKSLANDKTDETAGLIQSWLDETEDAA